jgi:hypothetical protein
MKEKANLISQKIPASTRLLLELKPGEVVTSTRLRSLAISERVTTHLSRQGVLRPLGVGAYIRGTDSPLFVAAVEALTEQLGYPVHIGGKTALDIQGVAQYLSLGAGGTTWLFSPNKIKLPAWFVKMQWSTNPVLVQTHFIASELDSNIRQISLDGFNVRVSARELAILEAILLIGRDHRFEEIDEIFESLLTLNGEKIQFLLQHCSSIRVCRIFLYLADKHGHPWCNKIDESKLALGKGKRMVVKDGQYDSKYRITVPREEEKSDV